MKQEQIGGGLNTDIKGSSIDKSVNSKGQFSSSNQQRLNGSINATSIANVSPNLKKRGTQNYKSQTSSVAVTSGVATNRIGHHALGESASNMSTADKSDPISSQHQYALKNQATRLMMRQNVDKDSIFN